MFKHCFTVGDLIPVGTFMPWETLPLTLRLPSSYGCPILRLFTTASLDTKRTWDIFQPKRTVICCIRTAGLRAPIRRIPKPVACCCYAEQTPGIQRECWLHLASSAKPKIGRGMSDGFSSGISETPGRLKIMSDTSMLKGCQILASIVREVNAGA